MVCATKTGCYFIAFLDMIFAALMGLVCLILSSSEIGSLAGLVSGVAIDDATRAKYGRLLGITIGAAIGLLVICIGKFLLGLTLKRALDKDDQRKCKIWLVATSVLFIFNLVASLGYSYPTPDYTIVAFTIIFDGFRMMAVYIFMKELQAGDTGTGEFKLANMNAEYDEKFLKKGSVEKV
jgi:hypothetical protein